MVLAVVPSILDDFVVRVVLGLDLGLGARARALLVVGWHFVNGCRLLVMIELGFPCRDGWFWMGRVLRGGRSVESALMRVEEACGVDGPDVVIIYLMHAFARDGSDPSQVSIHYLKRKAARSYFAVSTPII